MFVACFCENDYENLVTPRYLQSLEYSKLSMNFHLGLSLHYC